MSLLFPSIGRMACGTTRDSWGDKLAWVHYRKDHKDHTPPVHGPAHGAGSALGQSCAPDLSKRDGPTQASRQDKCSAYKQVKRYVTKRAWPPRWGQRGWAWCTAGKHPCRTRPQIRGGACQSRTQQWHECLLQAGGQGSVRLQGHRWCTRQW